MYDPEGKLAVSYDVTRKVKEKITRNKLSLSLHLSFEDVVHIKLHEINKVATLELY
jgi:hypothetical protein